MSFICRCLCACYKPDVSQPQAIESSDPETSPISSRFLQASGSWEKVNQEWLNMMHYLDVQNALNCVMKTNQQITDIIVDCIGSDYTSEISIYSIAPGLINPTIPLLDSFRPMESTTSSVRCGSQGKVKFMHLNGDNVEKRCFAIKEPFILMANGSREDASKLDTCKTDDVIKKYENNLTMTTKIGNHSNFMKPLGVVVKQENKKTKPYLIIEHIRGTILSEIKHKNITLNNKLELFSQLEEAFTHLLLLGIKPCDVFYNILITDDMRLKMIDFDKWESTEACSLDLAIYLHEQFRSIIDEIEGWDPEYSFKTPPFVTVNADIKQSFELSVDQLINAFSRYLKQLERTKRKCLSSQGSIPNLTEELDPSR